MPTRSLMNADDRRLLLERFDRLRPEARPAWGTLDAPRMLCHLGDGLRVALGEIPAAPKHSWASRTIAKFVVVHTGVQPPRGKIKTAPEMLTSKPASWTADVEACKKLAARVGAGEAKSAHPAFGPLTPEEWGKISWKEMDHHLRQFNV